MSRAALFDLAVNRAASYAARLGALPADDAASLHQTLELWYLKTRFAYRVPLDGVIDALLRRPDADADVHWSGGEAGGWREGGGPRAR